MEEPRRALLHLLDTHADAIVDAGTHWVRSAASADLATRPYAETRHLVAQLATCYHALLLDNNPEPLQQFVDFVTSFRSNLKFNVSTLLRGLRSFREGLVRVMEETQVPAELVAATTQLVDELAAVHSFELADLYVAKLNRVLDATREELIRKDKLAALGGLVAGVAHEINTPIGVAVTAASLAADRIHDIDEAFASGTLRRQDLAQGLSQAQEAARMTLGNLRRAAEMIANFKQIAVDQTSEAQRPIELGAYVREVVASLGPLYRRTAHRVTVAVHREVALTTYAGAISQVCTNLVHNALTHAFVANTSGRVTLEVDRQGSGMALLRCRDDGVGMTPEIAARVFEPFFTTQRGRGGSGLGMHIVHNLVTDLLGGSITLQTHPGRGTIVEIRVPILDEAPK